MSLDTLEQAGQLGRRERKKRATRLALKAAALELVSERGFANVTVEDIADKVDVSVRTFFNYFPTKEAAVVGEDPSLIEEMKELLIGLPPQLTPLDTLEAVLIARIRAIGEDFDHSGEDRAVMLRRLEIVKSQPEVLAAYSKHLFGLERQLAEALLERLGGAEELRVYASLVAAAAVSVMRVAATCSARQDGTEGVVEAAERAFALLRSGLDPGSEHATTGEIGDKLE
jgi:AcrR family transcriptional regulator